MKKYLLFITILFPLFLYAQSDLCSIDQEVDSLMTISEKKTLKCLTSINYTSVIGKKELRYFDSLFLNCKFKKMNYLIPAKFYLAGVSYTFSDGLYIKVYVKKFKYLKNRIDQKPWSRRLLMKEKPGTIQIFYYEKLICEYK